MKKKVFFTIALIVLIVSEMSIVHADLVMPGERFYKYSNDAKIKAFLEMVGSPLKEITIVLTICAFILAMLMLFFYLIENKDSNESNNSIKISKKIYLVVIFILNALQIQILRCSLIFENEFSRGTLVEMRENRINNNVIPTIYIIYIVLMILLSIFEWKKKKEKTIYIATIIITIILFIVSGVIVHNTTAGYYVNDGRFNIFGI